MSKKLFKVLLISAFAGATIKITADKLKRMKAEYRRAELRTRNDVIKTYTAFMTRRLVEINDKKFEGCELKTFCSKMVLDITRINVEKDIYISFISKASSLTIITPKDVKVIVEATRKMSEIHNHSRNHDKNVNTIYVIGSTAGSKINIIPENMFLDDDDDELM